MKRRAKQKWHRSKKDAPTTALRMVMLQRGWETEDVARLIGMDIASFRAAFSTSFRVETRVKLAIEDAIGQPFWSSPEEFQTRRDLGRMFFGGRDPFLVPVEKVRRVAFKHGISYFTKTKRQLIEEMSALLRKLENENSN
jgi:hypothetical protein